jgi:pantothenate kinase type III
MHQVLGASSLCLVSGGGGPALIEHIDVPCRYVENLVLEGLVRIATS